VLQVTRCHFRSIIVLNPFQGRLDVSSKFNMFLWSDTMPLCDDLWLGMQARNIAIVDQTVIRDIEREALAAFAERDKTPSDILLVLSALSQMWIFSLYEFLRTWRQRADEFLKIGNEISKLPDSERTAFIAKAVRKAEEKEKFILVAPKFYSEHVAQLSDTSFIAALIAYRDKTEHLFRSVEALRMNIAKHEVPKTDGYIAEAPGYARMSYHTGALYWHVTLKDRSQIRVDRREISNGFLGFETSNLLDDPDAWNDDDE
jgi:hypothetical protein